MPESRNLFNNFIKKVEGYKEEPYDDIMGNPTIGTGLNLNDSEVQGLMQIRGIDPEHVKSGQRKMANDELGDIHKQYVDKRERLVRDKVGGDVYDTLKPNERAALMSMGYQSLNNIGPNLSGHIASGDPIGAMREILLNTNKEQNPGILKRRFEEAELYGGPLDFTSVFKTMTPEEKKMLLDTFGKLENDNVKQEVIGKYGSYLGTPQPSQFNKLKKLFKP